MAKNKVGLQFDGLENMITSLEKAQVDVKGAVDSALKASKDHVTKSLMRDTIKANYPAKGKYSTGDLAKSIDNDHKIKWQGLTAETNIGYDFKKSGLVSIFMLYGTPRHKKAKNLYNDIYGSKVQKELATIQQETLNKVLEGALNGR